MLTMVRSPYIDWFSDVTGSQYSGIYVAVVFGVVNVSLRWKIRPPRPELNSLLTRFYI